MRWRADFALAFVALTWGTTFVVVKQSLPHISTMYFLTLRFGFASACMLALFAPSLRRSGLRNVWRGLRGGIAAGLFLWLGYVLQTFGLKYTSAGNSGFITGLYIVFVPLLGAVIYRRWPKPAELIGVLIATAGMAVLVLPSLDRNLRINRGDFLTAACAAAFAFHLLVLGYFTQRELFQAVALGQIATAALLSAASLAVEPAVVLWNASLIFAIVLTGFFATALAFGLQTWVQQYTTPTRTALIFALEPVFALVTAVVIGGETATRYSVVGGALILIGILAVELKPRRAGTAVGKQ